MATMTVCRCGEDHAFEPWTDGEPVSDLLVGLTPEGKVASGYVLWRQPSVATDAARRLFPAVP